MINRFRELFQLKNIPLYHGASKSPARRKFTFQDYTFLISPGDSQYSAEVALPDNGIYEPWVTKYIDLASKFYGSDKDAVDIGANIGIITLVLARLQNQGLVIAFEPLSAAYKQLVNNTSVNKVNNIQLEKFIVSDTNCEDNYINISSSNNTAASFVSNKTGASSVHTEKVNSLRLDSYLEQCQNDLDIKIVKIDVENWEQQVLLGAANTLLTHDPVVFIEFNVELKTIKQEKIGYDLYQQIKSQLKYIFLIDRVWHGLIPIRSYSELRGTMLSGHFVEDLLCFNDSSFFEFIQESIVCPIFTTNSASRLQLTASENGAIHSLSHYPDNWNHGNDFFLCMQTTDSTTTSLILENKGPHPELNLLIAKNDDLEELILTRDPVSLACHSLDTSSIYIFVDKTFLAKKYMNPNDPRELGIQIKIEETSK